MIALDRNWLNAHPLPDPGSDTDKNKRGRVLAAGGSLSVSGALLLTGEAAFRAGAGKVQLATVEAAAMALAIRLPEVASYSLPANKSGELAGSAGATLRQMLERCDALVLGPGMGPEADSEQILDALLSNTTTEVPLLLDAAIIGAAAAFRDQLRLWPGHLLMTPNSGEMAALFGCEEADLSNALAEEAAQTFDATIVLKGPQTMISASGKDTLVFAGGGHGLATAGSGDVLAGLIAGLLARGADPVTAAGWGVWLHGNAGLALAERIGPLGFLASELLAEIPRLMTS